MAVFSMTGYAGRQLEPEMAATTDAVRPSNELYRIGLEMRSVNSRFLDMTFRMPDEWRSLEPALRELLQKQLKRGKVEVRLWHEQDKDRLGRIPSMAALQKIAQLQDHIGTWVAGATPLSVSDILRMTDASNSQASPPNSELLALAKKVLDDLKNARAQEGTRLATMLRDHCQQLRQLTQTAAPLVPAAVQHHQERFLSRWKEALTMGEAAAQTTLSAETKAERALTEAASFAIRVDIAEELTRLTSHIEEIEKLLQQGGELGKRLDFLIQELHREANTLGSKSQSIELTRVGVDMKVLIEQMREQVQNIE